MRTALLTGGKVILTAVAMVYLSFFFTSLPKPLANAAMPPDELVEIASKLGWIAWVRSPALCLAAILVVAFAAGLLFARSRRIVRPAVALSVLVQCYDPMAAAIYFSDITPLRDSGLVRYVIIPLVGIGLIALFFAPFFHDCGRVLRGYLERRMPREGGR